MANGWIDLDSLVHLPGNIGFPPPCVKVGKTPPKTQELRPFIEGEAPVENLFHQLADGLAPGGLQVGELPGVRFAISGDLERARSVHGADALDRNAE